MIVNLLSVTRGRGLHSLLEQLERPRLDELHQTLGRSAQLRLACKSFCTQHLDLFLEITDAPGEVRAVIVRRRRRRRTGGGGLESGDARKRRRLC